MSNPVTTGTAGGAGAGKSSFGALLVTPTADVSALVPLFRDLVTGTDLGTVVLTVTDSSAAGAETAATFTFEDVFLESDTQSEADGDDVTQDLQFDYRSVMVAVDATSGGTPPPALAEAPYAVALPLAAAAVGAAVVSRRRRRHGHDAG